MYFMSSRSTLLKKCVASVLSNIDHGRYRWQFLASPPCPILADMAARQSGEHDGILALRHGPASTIDNTGGFVEMWSMGKVPPQEIGIGEIGEEIRGSVSFQNLQNYKNE